MKETVITTKEKLILLCFIISMIFNVFGFVLVINTYGLEKISKKVISVFNNKQLSFELESNPYWNHKVTQFEILNESLVENNVVF